MQQLTVVCTSPRSIVSSCAFGMSTLPLPRHASLVSISAFHTLQDIFIASHEILVEDVCVDARAEGADPWSMCECVGAGLLILVVMFLQIFYFSDI